MLTSSNIYRIDFEESIGGVIIPHSVIFNITQISQEEVNALIQNEAWEDDDRLISVRPNQLKYFQDKEN